MKKNKNRGFSLVELIIVVAIMATLSALLLPQYIKYVEKSRVAVCANNIYEVERAMLVEAVDLGVSKADPNNEELLDAAMATVGGIKLESGVYTGVCPSGGEIRVDVDMYGDYMIYCTKHRGNSSFKYNDSVGAVLFFKSLYRTYTSGANKGQQQTLIDYLKSVNAASIDSGAPDTISNVDKSFTRIINDALGGTAIEGQSWAVRKVGNSVYMYVTTDGSIEEKKGQTVNVVKYKYNISGTLLETTNGTVTVDNHSSNGYTVLNTNTYINDPD